MLWKHKTTSAGIRQPVLQQTVHGNKLKAEGVSHSLTGYFAFYHVHTAFDPGIFPGGLFPTFIGEFDSLGNRGISERYGGGHGNRAWHILYTVMHNTIYLVDWVTMSR